MAEHPPGVRGRRRGPARWPLQRRLVALVLVLLAAAASVVGVVSTLALRDSLLANLDAEVVAASRRAMTGPGVQLEGRGQRIGTLRVATDGGRAAGIYITARAELAELPARQAAAVLSRLEAVGRPQTVVVEGLGRYRMVAQQAAGPVLVATGLPLDDVDATLTRHVATTAAVTLAGLAVLGLLGTLLVRRELRPLARVAATASAVAATPLDRGEVALPARVPDGDTDPDTEVGRVGAALNQLLAHVEDALAARHRSETQVRRFVADASHELRTPLASIRGYAELVRRVPGEVPPDVLAAMDRVESEARRMTSLVEDLLLLARLDAGRPLERAPVDLAALAADGVSDAHAAAPDHWWVLDVPDDAPSAGTVVVGDENALRQVLANLLANARVHTPPGTTVTTTVRPAGGAAPGTVAVLVRDDGPGFPAELADRLFDRFTRADAARSPGTGTGLGLAIADAVVRAHGGTITADGTPGATTFTVTLPVAGPAPPPPGGAAD
jgi:two-component system OmpR family sensor kinase